jgi:hypothetical protein
MCSKVSADAHQGERLLEASSALMFQNSVNSMTLWFHLSMRLSPAGEVNKGDEQERRREGFIKLACTVD